MKPQQIENNRYKKDEHCKINLEEDLMFEVLEKYAKQLNKKKEEIIVLDIGCGSGAITKKIIDLGYSAEGLDFSEEAVSRAIKNGINAKVCDLDTGISKPDQKYDFVWAGDIIEHVFDPIGLLKEINRVLKPSGKLILSIPSDVGLVSRIKMLFGISYQEQMYRRSGYYKHHTFFNLSLISFMLSNVNLAPINISKILILNKKRYRVDLLPSAFYNTLVITASKK